MTKTTFSIALMTALLTACSSDSEYSATSFNNYSSITVSASTSAEDVTFPITIAAYDNDGNKAQQQEITAILSRKTVSLQVFPPF